ncbi:hypothetical protein L1987_59226 [Smallanthus sonchifolius]|uniref:Uncharacterized protein n=1 Tax=Smallanthus sonchifolius TaxID=185202 RepID=A0ACB9D5I7_9ASTR|nr:hypothetical protein L1987_59226 [Smallanthus sonchifolius]
MSFKPLVSYCRPVEHGVWATAVENEFGPYTPCATDSLVTGISHLVLLGACIYRIWVTKKNFQVQRFKLRSNIYNYLLGLLALYSTVEPLFRLITGISAFNVDGETSLAPYEIVTLAIKALAWWCMLVMIVLETKVYVYEVRRFLRFGVVYALLGDAVLLNLVLSVSKYYTRYVLYLFASEVAIQVLFGLCLLVYLPTLDPYPGYTPIRDESLDDAEYEELAGGEEICPERHTNIISSFGGEAFGSLCKNVVQLRLISMTSTHSLMHGFMLIAILQREEGIHFLDFHNLVNVLGVLCEAQYFQNVMRGYFKLLTYDDDNGTSNLLSMMLLMDTFIFISFSTASNPVTSHFVVCSFPYHYRFGSSLPTIRCCFNHWCIIASSHVPHTVKCKKMSKEGLQRTDKRIGLMNEILAAMDTVKCYAWENSFQEKVQSVRTEELSWFQKVQMLGAVVNANVSLKRLEDLLLAEERLLLPNPPLEPGLPAISIRNGFFSWDSKVCDNILFGSPFESAKYEKTLDVNALQHDLELLPGGDLTEIDVYVFDDPLSALDAHVGRQVFEKCIKEELRGKTRVLVTNQLHFLSQADRILLVHEGTVEEEGSYEELSQNARKLHNAMLNSILRAPMVFFHTNPLVRIINRFAKDLGDIDRDVAPFINMFLGQVSQILSTFVLIGLLSTMSLWAILPLLLLFYAAYLYYQSTAHEVKRMDSITRSPVYAQFGEALNGLSTIRAYKAYDRMAKINGNSMDNNIRFTLVNMIANL